MAAVVQPVKVRFAPSPTGNLHVGGARTALFNWLYAQRMGGSLVLRVEDTDAARSTRESEAAVLEDLRWLGITWDEGPDKGGPSGPYRQSERKDIYDDKIQELLSKDLVYPDFCSDEELEAMKREAEELKLPPIYRGKWSSASAEEVEAEMAKGTPYCYRFRVAPEREIVVRDLVRGTVVFNTSTLGDFVVMRSNGLPVYNFCVAVDDALMGVTHVLRAEEHLPNTMRQLLIYDALGFEPPAFGHMSLILAPDKSKLSKRHGATSVGEFRDQGFLKAAMMNYLSLLGWNDGSEKEIYSVAELTDAFSIDRITRSPAVFDKTKLAWMNGQHLRALPSDELDQLVGDFLVAQGIVSDANSTLIKNAIALMRDSLELVPDSASQLARYVSFPLQQLMGSGEADSIKADNLRTVAEYIIAKFDSGEFQEAARAGTFKKFIKDAGKELKCKGKRLFMPVRICTTGQMAGPDIGELMTLLIDSEASDVDGLVPISERIEILRSCMPDWPEEQSEA